MEKWDERIRGLVSRPFHSRLTILGWYFNKVDRFDGGGSTEDGRQDSGSSNRSNCANTPDTYSL